MAKLLAESLQEYREIRNLNEEQIEEGALDFFKGARGLVKQALKDTSKEENLNKALCTCFAKQCADPKFKKAILAKTPEDKIKIIKLAEEKLQDPKIGSLTLAKNKEGKLVVLGAQLAGGAGHSVSGA